MCKGFVRIPNRLFETKWWNKKRIYSESDAIIDLYSSADKRNSITITIRTLAEKWIWEQTRVLRFLDKLAKEGYIEMSKAITGTTIVILDFGQSATPSTMSSREDNIDNNPPLPHKENGVYDWSVVSDDMRPIVENWVQYKKEKKQTYKPTGFKVFYKKLVELSGNDPVKAKKIIEQSIANNWAGIFEIRQEVQILDNTVRLHNNSPEKFKDFTW